MVAKLLLAILHSFLRQLPQLCFRVWQTQAHHPSLAAGNTRVFSAHALMHSGSCRRASVLPHLRCLVSGIKFLNVREAQFWTLQ
jgi:hypothetical protein